jgi:hypothetical protein
MDKIDVIMSAVILILAAVGMLLLWEVSVQGDFPASNQPAVVTWGVHK